MAWYRDGTVRVTNGSATVTGTGTLWGDNKQGIGPGQMLLVPAAGTVQVYEILRVDSNTQLTLKDNFVGTTSASSVYAIPSFYTDSVPDFARRLAAQLSYYQSQMDGWQQIMTGTGSVTLTTPNGQTVTISSFKKLTDDMEAKLDKSKNLSDISDKGAARASLGLKGASVLDIGTSSGTVAAGDDGRLNTINGKTGGAVSTAIVNQQSYTARGPIPSEVAANFGVSMSWSNTDGNAFFQNNNGGGFGHYIFRVVNSTNTAELTKFTMNTNGQGQSPAGWVSTCDEGVKDKITEINPEEALRAICSWRTATWKYYDVPSELDEDGKVLSVVKGAYGVGFIAQDVEKDCPEAVTSSDESSLYITDEGELFSVENVKSLNTSGATAAYAGAAIKALKKRNDSQAELILSLSERLEAIEKAL